MQRQKNRHNDWEREKDGPGGCLRWKPWRDGAEGDSKLTWRVKCKELNSGGPGGLGVLGESGTEGPGARNLTYLCDPVSEGRAGFEAGVSVCMCVQPPPWAAGLLSLELGTGALPLCALLLNGASWLNIHTSPPVSGSRLFPGGTLIWKE